MEGECDGARSYLEWKGREGLIDGWVIGFLRG